MTLAWYDLTVIQRRVIAKISHGDETEERVGVELESFKPELKAEIGLMIDYGLVDVKVGWRDAVWVTLSERGRRVRNTGHDE